MALGESMGVVGRGTGRNSELKLGRSDAFAFGAAFARAEEVGAMYRGRRGPEAALPVADGGRSAPCRPPEPDAVDVVGEVTPEFEPEDRVLLLPSRSRSRSLSLISRSRSFEIRSLARSASTRLLRLAFRPSRASFPAALTPVAPDPLPRCAGVRALGLIRSREVDFWCLMLPGLDGEVEVGLVLPLGDEVDGPGIRGSVSIE